ncbi:uncharacterized protein TRIADDRAFT_14770, partial [Trichoplax adhaerens]
VLIIFYVIVFILAMFGNSVIVCVIIKNFHRKFRTSMHLMIFNLAITHLLLTGLSLPIALSRDILGYWFANDALCYFYGSLTNALAIVEMLTMEFMTVERYRAVANYRNRSLTKSQASIGIVVIWLVGISIVLPSVISPVFRDLQTTIFCTYRFHSYELHNLIYTSILLMIVYLIPFAIIMLLYSCLAYNLRHHNIEVRERLGEAAVKNNRKVTNILWILSGSFFLCWLPIFICVILIAFSTAYIRKNFCTFRAFFIIAHLLGYVYGVVNPLVLVTLSDAYKN